jgi:hypothetical protein
MALEGQSSEHQEEFWGATRYLPSLPGHLFYEKLNGILAEAGFDEWVEELCSPYPCRLAS